MRRCTSAAEGTGGQLSHRIPNVSAVLRPLPLADMSSPAPLGEQLYAGQRLGLPEDGPGSVLRMMVAFGPPMEPETAG